MNKYISIFGKQKEREKFKSKMATIIKEAAIIGTSLLVGFIIWIILAI